MVTKEYLEKEYQETLQFIRDRFIENNPDKEIDDDLILSLNCDWRDTLTLDFLDEDNHHFDLGKIIFIKRLLEEHYNKIP